MSATSSICFNSRFNVVVDQAAKDGEDEKEEIAGEEEEDKDEDEEEEKEEGEEEEEEVKVQGRIHGYPSRLRVGRSRN